MTDTVLPTDGTAPVLPTEKLGVDNLWKVLATTLELGNVVDKMIVQKEQTWVTRFLGNALEMTDDVALMFTVKYNQILPEFKDLDAVERADLLQRAKDKFDIPDDKVEEVVEKTFEIIFSLGDTILSLVSMIKALKK